MKRVKLDVQVAIGKILHYALLVIIYLNSAFTV